MTTHSAERERKAKEENAKVAAGQVGSRPPPNKEFERKVIAHVANYAKADNIRAAWDLLITYVGFFISLWMCNTTLLSIIPGGLFLLRMFVFFHDACHNSSFSTNTANHIAALISSPFILTPPSFWSFGHNYHHKHSNNLDKKQFAQTAPLTTAQFMKLSWTQKALYAFVYNGASLVTITPMLYFLVLQRLKARWYENMLSLVCLAGLYFYSPFLFTCYWGCAFIGAVGGVFLFHVQHTFEGSKRYRGDEWRYFENALEASSYFQVPWLLKFFTYGIEYHHIHHLNTRVPGHRLKQCHEEGKELFQGVHRVSLWEGIKSLRFGVYSEPKEEYESFPEALKTDKKEA